MINRRSATLAAATAIAIGGGWAAPLASHADITTVSYVTALASDTSVVHGTPIEWWTPGGGAVSVSGDAATVVVSTSRNSENYTFTFAAAQGQDLAVGSYASAQKVSSRDAGRPGIDVSGPWGACNSLTGNFVVSDLHLSDAGGVDRLRLHYEETCLGATGALVGEVAINEAPADPTVVTIPETVVFPPTYVDTASASAEVPLVNEGATPLAVSAVTIGGADAAKFKLLGNSCVAAPVQAGSACLARIAFTPGEDRAAAAASVVFTDDSTGPHSVALSATVQPGYTSWDMAGDRDDTVLGPLSVEGTPSATDTIAAYGTPNSVTVRIVAPRPYPYEQGTSLARFTVPDGQALAPGDYSNAADAGSTAGPGVNLDYTWSQCPGDPQHGSFHIDELTFDSDSGGLTALAVTFETHCGSNPAAAYGSIAWHATNPAAERAGPGSSSDTSGPGTPANARGGGGVKVGYVHLWWLNPPDIDWERTVIREAVGTTPPASPTSGTLVYSGRGSAATLTGRIPGRSYSYSIWGVDTRGNWSVPAHASVHGTVTILALPKAAPYGVYWNAAAEVIDLVTGKAVLRAPVHFGARYPGTTKWFGGSANTGDLGSGRVGVSIFPFLLKHSAYMHAVYYGGPGVGGSSTATVLEPLSPGLVGSYIGSLSPGGTEKISGTILPNLAGQRIYLQRHSGGVWLPFKSMVLSSKSTFGFAFPLSAGTYTFRLYMAAVHGFKPLVTSSIIVYVR